MAQIMLIIPIILVLLPYNFEEMIFSFKDSILMSVTPAIETNKIICVCTHTFYHLILTLIFWYAMFLILQIRKLKLRKVKQANGPRSQN